MIQYVVCSPISCASGRLLANAITTIQGRKCRYRNQGHIRHPERFHVRYGSHKETSNNCLNKLEAVKLASNKCEALLRLVYNGVSVPPHIRGRGQFVEIAPYRRIFRKNLRHAGNDNPLIVEPNSRVYRSQLIPAYDYCMECIDVIKEFRVHVFRDNAFKYQIKLPREGDVVHPYIRSENRGWRLVSKKEPPRPDGKLGPLAVKAVEALGLDFGAVDILMDYDGDYFVIEVNTAPGLSERKASLYAQLMVDWTNNQGE